MKTMKESKIVILQVRSENTANNGVVEAKLKRVETEMKKKMSVMNEEIGELRQQNLKIQSRLSELESLLEPYLNKRQAKQEAKNSK